MDALLPKISVIRPVLSATLAFFILSSTFRIVPSAFCAISFSIVLGFIPKACNALALALVLAPCANSAYILFKTVLVCSAFTPVDIIEVAKAILDSLAKFIFLANPAVLDDTSANCSAVTGYLFDIIFIVSM